MLECLGFSVYKMSSVNKCNSTSFWFWCPLFLFLVLLPQLGLQYYVEKKWWEWAPFSCSDLREKAFNLFTIVFGISCGLIICGLYYVEVRSFYTWFVENVYMNGWWICQMHFLCLLRWSYNFFHSVNAMYHIYWMCLMSHSLVPGMNSTWSWWMILLMCCRIWFASILLRIFAPIFIWDIGL